MKKLFVGLLLLSGNVWAGQDMLTCKGVVSHIYSAPLKASAGLGDLTYTYKGTRDISDLSLNTTIGSASGRLFEMDVRAKCGNTSCVYSFMDYALSPIKITQADGDMSKYANTNTPIGGYCSGTANSGVLCNLHGKAPSTSTDLRFVEVSTFPGSLAPTIHVTLTRYRVISETDARETLSIYDCKMSYVP